MAMAGDQADTSPSSHHNQHQQENNKHLNREFIPCMRSSALLLVLQLRSCHKTHQTPSRMHGQRAATPGHRRATLQSSRRGPAAGRHHRSTPVEKYQHQVFSRKDRAQIFASKMAVMARQQDRTGPEAANSLQTARTSPTMAHGRPPPAAAHSPGAGPSREI